MVSVGYMTVRVVPFFLTQTVNLSGLYAYVEYMRKNTLLLLQATITLCYERCGFMMVSAHAESSIEEVSLPIK